MLILLSCAKIMTAHSKIKVPEATVPLFRRQSSDIAIQVSQFSVEQLERLLKVNTKIGIQNYQRFQNFHSGIEDSLQALLAYTGIVYKRLCPEDFTGQDFLYAQEHLRITSFCYGLLRPLDLIKNYRMEGDIRLPEFGNITLFDYWKPLLTDVLIDAVKAGGGILINLASSEMKGLFDWKRVESEVRVITPEFQIEKGGKLSTIVVYTKMARGEMARFVLKSRISDPEKLKSFDWEGFTFREDQSNERNYLFTISQ